MNIWNQLPLLRILFPFFAGIIIALALPVDLNIPFLVIISIFCITAIFIFFYKQIVNSYSNRWIFGLLLNLLIFCCGYQLTSFRLLRNQSADFSNIHSLNDTVIATIADPVNERENTCRVLLSIDAVWKNGEWHSTEGKAMTYFKKDSTATRLKYGDQLILCAGFADVKAPQNPGEFDYKNYLAMRSIYSQAFVKSGNWAVLAHDKGFILKSLALKIREKFLKIFETNNISGEEYAVAGALILGYTDKIDADLISVYQGTGALHILSVSGMHVGVVFIVLNFLLAFLDRFKKGRYLKPVILVLLIWFYAAITGFSPAVNRAAAMITFIIIGKASGRFTNIYNTLAASMLLLLLIDPLLVMDVGFQLSYIAVFGIVILQKNIYKLWSPRTWILNQVWQIVTVSIAAQLATFPLGLLYFHQFPNYFLITNLIVVPLSNFIIYCGMLVLILSPLNVIAAFVSKLLVYFVFGLNQSIRFIESMPYSAAKGIHITSLEMILIYLLIISIAYFFFSRRIVVLRLSFLIAIVIASSLGLKNLNSLMQKKMIVYNLNKSSAIDLIAGQQHTLICDSLLKDNSKLISTHLMNNWNLLKLYDPDYYRIDSHKADSVKENVLIESNFIQFYDKRLAIVNSENCKFTSDNPIKVDYLILCGNIEVEIGELLDSYKPDEIIFDSSNSMWKIKKWKKECEEVKIPHYSVLDSGAFQLEL